tara:strand:+ start:311 stop:496 length:186 start_codon:yes stop_codon:yes gene_type:complete
MPGYGGSSAISSSNYEEKEEFCTNTMNDNRLINIEGRLNLVFYAVILILLILGIPLLKGFM